MCCVPDRRRLPAECGASGLLPAHLPPCTLAEPVDHTSPAAETAPRAEAVERRALPCNACPLCFMPCTYGASLLLYVSYLAVIRARHAVESEIRPPVSRLASASGASASYAQREGLHPRLNAVVPLHVYILRYLPPRLTFCRRPAWDLVASPALRFPTSTTRSKASTLTPQTVRMTALTAPLLLAGPGRTRTLAMATWHGAWNMLPPSIRSSLWPLPAVSRILICLLARSRRLLASSRCSRAGCACVTSPATKGASI